MTERPAPGCAKCGAAMEPGFVANSLLGYWQPSDWLGGDAARALWLGARKPRVPKRRVATWRCPGCGYLEAYAQGDV